MYAVSEEWANATQKRLAPEGFVELSIHIPQLKEVLTYTNVDLLRFSHYQTGSIVSAELPKNSIEFSINNTSGQWNPINPDGIGRYLSERLKITVRYGYNINGVVEWIPGGVFYLSEWDIPSNGLEASFVARDILEYMIDKPYTGAVSGTLYDLATRAIAEAELPEDATVQLCEELKDYTIGVIEYDGGESVAEILQKCANAACCVIRPTRDGVLSIERVENENCGFIIPREYSYTYPEIGLLSPLKDVSVSYSSNQTATFKVSDSGETQTVTNNFISSIDQAIEVGTWVGNHLKNRVQISGDFRGDARFDLFDTVGAENKYGTIAGVLLTDIKVVFTGAFRVTYTGYVYTSGVKVSMHLGEIYMGEVL